MADFSSTTVNLTPPHPSTFAPVAGESILRGAAVRVNAADGKAIKAQADTAANALVVGLARVLGTTDERFIAQYGDILQLDTEDWDAVTGGSGGLTLNALYYLSSTTAGHLTTVKPVAGGTLVAPVGRAVSATELLILIGTPVQNS